MEKDEIISRLKEGWDLANRGRGWWLSAPRVDYKATETIKVNDQAIEELEREGLIKTDLPYNTLFARLVS
jgi:hypothetical protein